MDSLTGLIAGLASVLAWFLRRPPPFVEPRNEAISVQEELGRCLLDFVAKDDEAMVKLLLEHEQKELFINCEDAEKGMTALMIATERGYIGIVKLLLRHRADVNRQLSRRKKVTQKIIFEPPTKRIILAPRIEVELVKPYINIQVGTTALMVASMNQDIDMAKLLLDHGANVNLKDTNGVSPLIISCSSKDGCGPELARLLLDHGANINAQTHEGWSAIMIATLNGHNEMVKLLLERNAQTSLKILISESALLVANRIKCTALMLACSEGHLETARLILEHGAEVNMRDELCGGPTALTIAAEKDDLEIAKLLLEYGADVYDGLVSASERHNIEMAKLLLKEGAPDHWIIRETLTTAITNRDLEMAKLLLERAATIDVEIGSVILTTCKNINLQMAELLLKHGADVNFRSQGEGWTPLMITSKNGCTEVVRLLLVHGADLDIQSGVKSSLIFDQQVKWTALMIAGRMNHLEIIEILLEFGADVNVQDSNKGTSALMIASESGQTEAVELLLRHGASIDLISANKRTALMIACRTEHLETIKLLLEHGADINAQDYQGISPLMFACEVKGIESIKLLLGHGADINMQDYQGISPLMFACEVKGIETKKLLLEHGADINVQDKDGISALMIACKTKDLETIKVLLEHGADINVQDRHGKSSALMSAVKVNFIQGVKVLLDLGANINFQNNEGKTALMMSVQMGESEMTKLLLDHGANVNLQDDGKYSALMFACQNGHNRVARLLLEYGANVNMERGNQWSPLMFLISSGKEHLHTVQRFLEKGARVNAQGSDGWTSLMLACNTSHTETVDVLVKHGADVNKQRRVNGLTALMIASQNGDTKIAEILLKHGADVNMKDSSGATALMYARKNRRTEIAKLLERYEAISTTSVVLASPKSPIPALNAIHEVTSEDLIAETSLLVTNSEQHFSWHEYGLQIYIPERSLPEDVHQCNIHIKVSIMGDYQLPQDVHLVSAVYSIKCIPKCQFSKPLILEVQHCAKPEVSHKLCFIRSAETGLKFHIIEPGKSDNISDSFFPQHTSYGFVELKEFCDFGVGVEGPVAELRYCANIYHRKEDNRHIRIHFIIVQNTNPHNELVFKHYERNKMELLQDLVVEFEKSQIELDIPCSVDGVATENDAWRISSLTPPVITREEVDSFGEGKRIPSCQMMAECNKPTDLKHAVNLKGAKHPYNVFVMFIRAEPSDPRNGNKPIIDDQINSGHVATSLGKMPCDDEDDTQSEITFTIASINSMLEEDFTDPHKLGIYLGIETKTLKEIEADHPVSVGRQRIAVIEHWKHNVHDCSWGTLADAVERMGGHNNLARRLQEMEEKELTLTHILKELSSKVAVEWENIGQCLGIKSCDLASIKHNKYKQCFRQMIKVWYKTVDPHPSWPPIIDAIERAGYKSLAKDLRSKYVNVPSESYTKSYCCVS